jgi:hypothetical protein
MLFRVTIAPKEWKSGGCLVCPDREADVGPRIFGEGYFPAFSLLTKGTTQ